MTKKTEAVTRDQGPSCSWNVGVCLTMLILILKSTFTRWTSTEMFPFKEITWNDTYECLHEVAMQQCLWLLQLETKTWNIQWVTGNNKKCFRNKQTGISIVRWHLRNVHTWWLPVALVLLVSTLRQVLRWYCSFLQLLIFVCWNRTVESVPSRTETREKSMMACLR